MEPHQGRTSEAAVFVEEFNASAAPREEIGPLAALFLKKRVAALRIDMTYLRAENEVLRAELKAANDRYDRLAEHLKNIYASRGWRLVLRLRRLRWFVRRLAWAFRPTDLPPAPEAST